MRLREFITKQSVDLYEINMSPRNLEQLASQIQGVRVGMEFEMCVSDAVDTVLEPGEPEREREDEPISSLEDIEEFFSGGNNSRQNVNRLMNRLDERWSLS